MTNVPEHLQVAEVDLIYKSKVPASKRHKVTGSVDAVKLIKEIWAVNTMELRESFLVLFLNRANKAIGFYVASTGGVTCTVADPKLIFCAALKVVACGIIVAHNHPSGNITPSQTDIQLTKKLKEAGKVLEIQLLDHVILTSESHYSFADEGIL